MFMGYRRLCWTSVFSGKGFEHVIAEGAIQSPPNGLEFARKMLQKRYQFKGHVLLWRLRYLLRSDDWCFS
jgi:hypothetical protein